MSEGGIEITDAEFDVPKSEGNFRIAGRKFERRLETFANHDIVATFEGFVGPSEKLIHSGQAGLAAWPDGVFRAGGS